MNTIAFDGRMGASGDMLLGALVAAGADPAVLTAVEDVLDVSYDVHEVTKNGIRATKVTVEAGGANPEADGTNGEADGANGDEEPTSDRLRGFSPGHSHDHGDHGHSDHGHGDHEQPHGSHGHSHDHGDHSHGDAEGHGPNRTYPEVVDVVEGMDLPASVERDAEATFEILAKGEAAVHGTDIEETHFHEVGADDAIADIVGVALLVDDLDPDRIVTTPVATGSGEVRMSHGMYPVPPPAVVEIAGQADWSIRGGPEDTELLTPTGAALLAHYAEGVDHLPPIEIEESGYGAGFKDFPERANVLRAIRGREEGRLVKDDVTVLETNLDDATPEVLGSLQETLKEAGARDVSIVPLTMKKSRPGHLVKVVTKPPDEERVARRLAEETGSLGVRAAGAGHRWIAQRTFETVEVAFDGEAYEVTVKIASDEDGDVYDVSAEFDDALAVAREADVPVRDVIRAAEAAAEKYR